MVTTPPATPVTTPLEVPTVAIEVLLLFQVPPVEELLRVMVFPAHTVLLPVMGELLIVIDWLAGELHPVEYIILEAPLATPVTIPVAEPTVAIAVLLLLQVP